MEENVEKLDTYSIQRWETGMGKAAFSSRGIVNFCKHFALTQTFFHFHDIWPTEANGRLGPEKPHVIGHVLENGFGRAIIHSLPICRIEKKQFVPRYTLFLVTYFSEQPEICYRATIAHNADYVEPGVAWPFIAPPDGCDHWWNLNYWVEREQLFWVDANDPELGVRTGDVASFPYGNIEGRTWPYLHTFPYPLPKPKKKKS
ncbi:MAG: hypothetical protein R3D55_02250 [Chloroflexota bacterium]